MTDNATPLKPLIDWVELARQFHDTYEELAPLHEYKTRDDTKAFDPSLPNGLLMIETVEKVVSPILSRLTAENGELRAEVERAKRLCAGALASLMRENWQPGPTEGEIHDDLWTYLDNMDDGMPLSGDKVTDDSRIKYLVGVYEGKS